jgi:spore germination protein (amino acid permease)
MERISTHQFMMLAAAVLLGTVFLPVASMVTAVGGRDGWLSALPGFIFGIPFAKMLLSMAAKYPNNNLIEITEKNLGKWIGKGIGIFYILVTTYLGGLLVGQGVDMYTRTSLPLMSRNVLIFGVFILSLYLFLSGIEVLARFAEVVFPIVILALICMVIITIPRFEQGELYPILADGITPVLKASTKIMPWPMEYTLFLAGLLPFISKKSKDMKLMYRGIWQAYILVIILITGMILIQLLTFGPFEVIRLTYGILVLGNMVEISRTIAGVESVFMMVWMGAHAMKVAALFFAGMWGLQSVFGLKNIKWCLLLALGYIWNPMFISRGFDVVVEIDMVDQYIILPFAATWVFLVWGLEFG